jgi:hydrogenase maturation protease
MVLGLGNVLNGDDGLGFYAIRDLTRERWPQNVCFVHRTEFKRDPLFFEQCRGLVLLDTVCGGKDPGTVYVLGPDELRRQRGSLRNPWILNAMAFSSLFGEDLSTELVGVEPECRDCGIRLAPAVSGTYGQFLRTARTRISSMLDRMGSSVGEGPEVSEGVELS